MKFRTFLSVLMATAMLLIPVSCDGSGAGDVSTASSQTGASSVSSTVSSESEGSDNDVSGVTTDASSSSAESENVNSGEASSGMSSVGSEGTSSAESAGNPSVSDTSSTSSGNLSSNNTSSTEGVPLEEGINAVITCTGTKATINGTGATVSGNVITVSTPGEYRFSGTWNGRILVNVPETEDVKLALYGFTATCSNNAVIEVQSADDVTIKSQNGYENFIRDTDGSAEKETDTRCKAAIYARSSLEFSGAGSLTVRSDYKHGVACTKKLVISNSTLNVTAVDCGLKGNNSVYMTGGNVTVNAGGDGIKTEDITDVEKGFVTLEGGTLTVNAKGDGIDASRSFDLCGAAVTVKTTGVDSNDAGSSSKGVKAGSDEVGTGAKMTLSSGVLSVTSTGHALRSSGSCNIQGTPKVTLASDKNGINTQGDMTIRGGTVLVTRSVEGLESKGNLKILGGTVTVTASDNGVNVSSDKKMLTVSGGMLDVTVTGSEADAIDSNGNMLMQGGVVIAKSKGKSAVNVAKTLTVSGGTLVAIGSVLSTPAAASTCNTVTMASRTWEKGTHVLACGGTDVVTFTLDGSYLGGYICSDKMTDGTDCLVRKDGTTLVRWTQSGKTQTVA